MDKKRMVGTEEAEILYSTPKGTLANWRSQKKGPKFYKINRKVLYKLEDLEDFFTANPVLTVDSIEKRDCEKRGEHDKGFSFVAFPEMRGRISKFAVPQR